MIAPMGPADLRAELESLQRRLRELAARPDEALTGRYTLAPPLKPGLLWSLRRTAARALRALQGLIRSRNPWPAALLHGPAGAHAKPLLIWAMGTDRETLREACGGFVKLQEVLPEFAPVLVTDVADFRFFSRLGWLVEYVPELAGEGESYQARKVRYLARLYRGAPALPVTVGSGVESRADEIRLWVTRESSTAPQSAEHGSQ